MINSTGDNTDHCSFHTAQHEFRVALCDSFNTPAAIAVLLDLIGKTNVYFARSTSYNIGVIETIALWITRMLRMFGLGEGPDSGGIGWGKEGATQTGTADVSAHVLHSARCLRGVFKEADATCSSRRNLTSTSKPCPRSETRLGNWPSPIALVKTFWSSATGLGIKTWSTSESSSTTVRAQVSSPRYIPEDDSSSHISHRRWRAVQAS